MLRTESEILNWVKTRYDETKDLRDRFEADYDLWRLDPYQLGKKDEYDCYTTNDPRTLADKNVEVLATAPLQIRIPLGESDEKERKGKSNGERLIYGAINLSDFRLQSRLQPAIQEQLAFYTSFRGWVGLRCYIHKDKNGNTIPDIAVWDIFRMAWEVGANGLLRACHIRPISKAQAEDEYKHTIKGKTAVAYDFWDEEVYAVIIGSGFALGGVPSGEFVIKPKEHKLGHPPVLITMVGATPFIQSDKYQDTIKDSGESVYGSNRHLYELKNKIMTYRLTNVGLGTHTPIVEKVAGGKSKLQKNPYYKGSQITLDSEKNESMEPLFQPATPKDTMAVDAEITREINTGGLSPLVYGQVPFPESGYEANLLMQASASAIKLRQQTIEFSLEWLSRELLTQFAKGGFGKLRLHGRDGSNEYFDVELSPKDVKGDWFPEVKLLPTLPENTAQKYTIAGIAIDKKILSKQSAREIVGVKDTDLEQRLINKEEAEELPSVKIRKLANAIRKDGFPQIADDILREFQTGLTAGEAKKPPKPEAKRPEYATGVSREVMPGEEIGQTPVPPEVEEEIRRLGA